MASPDVAPVTGSPGPAPDLSGTTVLVTGANGFVGTRTCLLLADAGAQVRALVRRAGESPAGDTARIDEVVGSFTDAGDAADAVQGADAVVHCAAMLGGDLATARAVNVDGAATVAAAAQDAGVRHLVHISTCAVYAYPRPDVVTESAALTTDESSVYPVTKAEAEAAVRSASADTALAILRPPAVLGAHPRSTWAVSVPDRIREGGYPLRGDGSGTFAWVHVDDLAGAVLRALTGGVTGTFTIVGGHEEQRAYVEGVRSWFPDAPEAPTRDGDVWAGRYDTSAAHDELGWQPAVNFAEAMDDMAPESPTPIGLGR